MEQAENKIVSCHTKHYAALADIGGVTFYDTFRPYHDEANMQAYISKTYSLEKVKENLQLPQIHYYLAYHLGWDQGYIKLIENPQGIDLEGSIMELEKIYLRKEAWGSGLAKQLLDVAIHKAKELGYQWLYLGVWQENERAISFYRKCGFEVFGTRQFQLGSKLCDDYLMALRLY